MNFGMGKKHIAKLLCQNDFTENNIPTKARPSQMNKEMVEYCKKEIDDLMNKMIIRKKLFPMELLCVLCQ